MGGLGFKSVVYHVDLCLGELDNVPVKGGNFQFPKNEIRIHHLSPHCGRSHPLAIFQTISPTSLRCKLEPCSNANFSSNPDECSLINLHASMFYDLKTAVVLLGNEEIHLVAMPSKQKKFPCFWCFSLPCGLFDSCLWMLNTCCLAIVFDLDETLIVANTMKSFEDKIEVLMGRVSRETDPIRESGMTVEMKRYVEDRTLLKQYAETDSVVDCGKAIKFQMEEVPFLSDGHARVFRPVVRLPEKNIILTRINPENRDTSVLVRLRPAWQDLKSYLTAKGRKRFEVYVCTMAEREYALEMWRLLDPEAHLISSKQLLDRVICVKSGSRKSLLNVFQNGNCHPNLALVIDDRLKVWEEKDQPHVHVVPAFSPYYAPQAETVNAVPVLCVVRNVACSVRSSFFKDFDENILGRIADVFYEYDDVNLPFAPDVRNYMMPEDTNLTANVNPNLPIPGGMNGHEISPSWPLMEEKNGVNAVLHQLGNNFESKLESSKLPAASIDSNIAPISIRAVPTSESSTEPPLSPKLSQTILQSQGGWLQEDAERRHASNGGLPESAPPIRCAESGLCQNHPSTSNEPKSEDDRISILQSLCIGVLQEIGRRCRSKVEFRPATSSGDDLKFSFQVFLTGEKIGVGMGKTRKDAQQQAAENALRSLADHYVSYVASQNQSMQDDADKNFVDRENGFLCDIVSPMCEEQVIKNEFS